MYSPLADHPAQLDGITEVVFRRIVKPLFNGKVRVTIECRLGGTLFGRIDQVRGGWMLRPTGATKRGWSVGRIYPTAAECKRAVADRTGGGEDARDDMVPQA